jgi:hypothetical protein
MTRAMTQHGGELYTRYGVQHFCFVASVEAIVSSPIHITQMVANTASGSTTESLDDILNGGDTDLPPEAWKNELTVRIEQIINLKRSTTEGRADSLNGFAHILMARYAKENIEGHMSELLPSIMKSIRAETTERETVVALKGKIPATELCYHQLIYHSSQRRYCHP